MLYQIESVANTMKYIVSMRLLCQNLFFIFLKIVFYLIKLKSAEELEDRIKIRAALRKLREENKNGELIFYVTF